MKERQIFRIVNNLIFYSSLITFIMIMCLIIAGRTFCLPDYNAYFLFFSLILSAIIKEELK